MKTIDIEIPVVAPLEPGGKLHYGPATVLLPHLRDDDAPVAAVLKTGRSQICAYRFYRGSLWRERMNGKSPLAVNRYEWRSDFSLVSFRSGWHPLAPTRRDAKVITNTDHKVDKFLLDHEALRESHFFKAIEARAKNTIVVGNSFWERTPPPFLSMRRDSGYAGLVSGLGQMNIMDERLNVHEMNDLHSFHTRANEFLGFKMLGRGEAFETLIPLPQTATAFDARAMSLESVIWVAARAVNTALFDRTSRHATELVIGLREALEARLPDYRLRWDDAASVIWPYETDAFEFPDAASIAPHLFWLIEARDLVGINASTAQKIAYGLQRARHQDPGPRIQVSVEDLAALDGLGDL